MAILKGQHIHLIAVCFLTWTNFGIFASNCGNNNGKNNGYFGETDVEDYNDGVDNDEGQSILLLADDSEYTFKCCGRIDGWQYRVGNVGEIYLQVWRNTGSTWELVGQNYNNDASSVGEKIVYDVPTAQEFLVKSGDVIGWHSPGRSVISYEAGWGETDSDDWYSSMSLSSSTTTYAWTTVGTHNDRRDFAIRADMSQPSSPVFDNLNAALSLTNTDTLSYTVTATDADTGETLTYTMTGKTGYTFDSSTATVTSTSTLEAGTHTLNFRVTDTCGNSDTGTLTLTVTNVPPEINNLPADTDVREDQVTELHLYDIDVTDASGDTVVCSVQSVSPSSNDFLIKIKSGTTINAIYVKSGASFDYDKVRQYDLTISCTDLTTSVTGTYTVYIIPNEPPVITNLAATTHVSTTSTSIGSDVFTVRATDIENDQLRYNMTCVPVGCPFIIYDSGLIESTADLTGHTQAGYDLYVYVYDGYNLVGPRTLTITLTDQNSVPVINNLPLSSALSLPENSAIGTSVFQTQVTDLNLGDNLVYTASYSPTSGASLFQTVSSTGLVSTAANIDFEALSPKTYTVTITVNDGQDSDTQSLQITIVDVNEAPVFAFQQYTLTGNEGQVPTIPVNWSRMSASYLDILHVHLNTSLYAKRGDFNFTITNFSFVCSSIPSSSAYGILNVFKFNSDVIGTPAYGVIDPDNGDTLSYSIDCQSLDIDSTSGQISLATDYDLDQNGTSDTISCNVTVSDGELTDTALVIVTLQNINDNTPSFTYGSYIFYCDSGDGVGTSLGTAAASDGDLGTNGYLSYVLDQSSLSSEYFGVTESGEIYIKTDIGYIYNRSDYIFRISATDTGGLVATSSVTVICQGYSTLAPINITERYITFFEDPRNLPWFVVLMIVLALITAFIAFLLARSGCFNVCHRVDTYCKRRWWKRRRERMRYRNRTESPVSLISKSPSPPMSPRRPPTRVDQVSPKPSADIWDPWTISSNLAK